jgi:hypothetical protein
MMDNGAKKSLSGLPAISPTRGEKTHGALLPQASRDRAARLSPPPCGEGLGGDFSEILGGLI